MIDIRNDEMLTLREATTRIPGRPHISTVFRWTADRKLDSIKVGGRRWTSAEAIDLFIDKCNGQESSEPTQRTKQIGDASRELERDGI